MKNTIKSLLGRTLLKTSKFKPLVSLAITRIAVLKHQRQARWSQSRSDVVQLLQQGNQERALLRVEYVIKEQNMLDVYDMLESYCNLLIERLHLIENERECPAELREAASSMLYAASRCGDFPELQEIRTLLTSHFGKEFAARSIELRNNCSVNHAMIIKLSTRQPSLENRMIVLKEIASENSIVLHLEEHSMELNRQPENQNQGSPNKSSISGTKGREDVENDDRFSDSVKSRKKFKDVADAAQAAFESAAYAAAAARAAVELSRSGHDSDNNQESPGSGGRGNSSHKHKTMKMESESEEDQIESLKKRSLSSSSSESVSQVDQCDNEIQNEKNSPSPSHTQTPPRFQAEDEAASFRINLEKVPFSMRTRKLRGY